MSKTVKPDALAAAIMTELESYRQDVTDGVKESVKQVAAECRDEIRQNSPRRTGRYRKGWRVRTEYEGREDIRLTVHNRTSYQLTHLLENGHAKRGGGRVAGRPHIRPAEQNAEKKLLRKVKVVVKGGS